MVWERLWLGRAVSLMAPQTSKDSDHVSGNKTVDGFSMEMKRSDLYFQMMASSDLYRTAELDKSKEKEEAK